MNRRIEGSMCSVVIDAAKRLNGENSGEIYGAGAFNFLKKYVDRKLIKNKIDYLLQTKKVR